MGPVFRAYDPERDRLIAVKVFTLDLSPERVRELVAAFDRLIAAGLLHDAIAAPLAAGISRGAAYLAYEYVPGESLDVAIHAYGPAPAGDALRVAAQLAGALDFAAVVNIHHGALHPRDVLLSPEDTRLTGIGVTRALEQVGIAAPVRRPYAAPERIAGAAWDRRADIFGLAALIHELLWGRRIAGTGAQVADALTDVPKGNLSALRSVFARALADDPADRFDTALEFAEALKNAFGDVTVVMPAAQPPARHEIVEAAPRLPLDEPEPLAATPTDFDLRAAEEARYAAVEVAPAIVAENLSTTEDTEDTGPSIAREDWPSVSPVSSVVESSAQRHRPLMAVLIFAAVAIGYLALWKAGETGNRVAPPPAAAANSEPAQPPTPPSREFTENTVPAVTKTPAPAPESAINKSTINKSTINNKSAIRNPQSAMTGRILVRSTPAGATVFVDGREYGQTPVAVRDLARGAHRVRLVRDGYAPAERRIVVTRARPVHSLIVPLAAPRATASRGTQSPAPSTPATTGRYTGDLVVESRPSGAKVFLDNKLAGTTPLSLPQVPAGSHAVRIERDGYRRWSSAVRVVAAERNRVTASLER